MEISFPDRVVEDFALVNHGSIATLTPQTPAALAWVEENIGEDNGYQPYWPSVVIEANYLEAVVEGIETDGLSIN